MGRSARLLVGGNTLDDAAVFRLGPDEAIVSTVDVFTPVVDAPRSYGRIAAANSLSDIYAMGGRPVLALNIACFSPEAVPNSVMREILLGGEEKVREAGVALGGGHSVEDKELKYGMCVTGIVRPDRVVRNSGARVGDAIILTKPLGIGLMTTGLKLGLLTGSAVRKVTRVMEELNAAAARVMVRVGASSCTDITGYGLLGHALEMARAGKVEMEIRFDSVPVMPEAYDMLRAEAVAGGLWSNKHYVGPSISVEGVTDDEINVLCDPQTSGGLLMTVPSENVEKAVRMLRKAGVKEPCIVGKVLAKGEGRIIVKR
jgi:selenide,water dikinase